MGWDYFQRAEDAPRDAAAIEAFLRDLFTRSNADIKQTVERYERVPGAAFLALRIQAMTSQPYTTAIVVLLANEGGALGWKTMDESMGPYEARASLAFLDMLSPVEQLPHQGDAAGWRSRVRSFRSRTP
jgi:hypothetical protein